MYKRYKPCLACRSSIQSEIESCLISNIDFKFLCSNQYLCQTFLLSCPVQFVLLSKSTIQQRVVCLQSGITPKEESIDSLPTGWIVSVMITRSVVQV